MGKAFLKLDVDTNAILASTAERSLDISCKPLGDLPHIFKVLSCEQNSLVSIYREWNIELFC